MMEFEIVNVGQGNFNVLKLLHFNLFYDMGAPVDTSESIIELNIIKNNEDLFNNDFGVVISHWDVDHYRLIISLDSLKKLDNIRFFIYPDDPPTTTSKKALSIIQKYIGSEDLHPIPNIKDKIEASVVVKDIIERGDTPYAEFEDNFVLKLIDGQQSTMISRNLDFISKHIFGCTADYYPKSIRLYHSAKRADRNKNSLLLSIKYSDNSYVFLTGDSYYRDINKYLFKWVGFADKVCFVVPHHGGRAGKFDLSYLTFNKGKAIISVGKDNRYKHPLPSNVGELESIFGNVNVKATTGLIGNITISLK